MNPITATDGQVDQIIGSAYQVIKYVAANMETLITLAESIDPLVDSMLTSFEALRRTYSESGYTLLKATFKTGAAIGDSSQVLLDDTTGIAYSWGGALPHFVPEDSTLISSGGVGPSTWIAKNLSSLRSQLASSSGVSMVGGVASEAGLLAAIADTDVKLTNLRNSTYLQLHEVTRRTYAEAGLNLVPGSFERGGRVYKATDVLLYEGNGEAYNWNNSFPVGGKDVSAGSVPSVSATEWLSKADSILLDLVSTIEAGSTLESRFSQKTRLGQSDCYVLVQGDSTGDADSEWFRLTANSIAAKYPTHSVRYVMWDHASTSWSAPVWVSTGSGPRTIWFYNGSKPGALASYWTGNRAQYAFNNLQFDVVFTNYGLNAPSSMRSQQEQHAEHLFFLKTRQPYAEVICCIQPVDYSLLDRNPYRSEGQKLASSLYGVRVIDVMRKFLDLVTSTGGNYTPWYIDSLHPSVAGSVEWAKLTTSALLTSKGDQPSVFTQTVKNADVPNGMFKSFISGPSASPDYWMTPNTTAIKDQVYYETFDQSVRVAGVGTSTGIFRMENANELMQRLCHYPQIVIAARLRSSGGSSGKCGKLFFAHSVSTAYAEIQSTQGPTDTINDGFRWVFLLVDRSFWLGKSDFNIGVFSGEAGEFVSIDRVLVSASLAISDCSSQDYSYTVEKSDSTHNIPANSSTTRAFTFTSPITPKPGMFVEVCAYPNIAGVDIAAACLSSGAVTVTYSNKTGAAVSFPASTIKMVISS